MYSEKRADTFDEALFSRSASREFEWYYSIDVDIILLITGFDVVT